MLVSQAPVNNITRSDSRSENNTVALNTATEWIAQRVAPPRCPRQIETPIRYLHSSIIYAMVLQSPSGILSEAVVAGLRMLTDAGTA